MDNREQSPADAISGFDGHSSSLKAQAERCRRLAAATYNREVAKSLDAMAEDYERNAQELSQRGG